MSSHGVIAHFNERLSDMLLAIEELMRIESPSDDPTALSKCGSVVECLANDAVRGQAQWYDEELHVAPQLRIDLGDRTDVLLVGHFDTVHPIGTLRTHGIARADNRLYGPGALDMKAGVVLMIEVARYVQQELDRPNVTLFFNSDEEVGSPHSSANLRALGAHAEAALVFEPTTGPGVIKTGLRGRRQIQVKVTGKGGHAAYPEKYLNPVIELARYIDAVESIADTFSDCSITPTILRSSQAANVVSPTACVEYDVRASREEDIEAIEAALRAVKLRDDRYSITVERKSVVPAFPMSDQNRTTRDAQRAAACLEMPPLEQIEGRGGSDANQLSVVLPDIVEGFGGWGDGMHLPGKEYVCIDSLVPSAALAAQTVIEALRRVDGKAIPIPH